MKNQPASYNWVTQKISPDCKTIDSPEHDNYKDFIRDSTGFYVLIKINWHVNRIEVAICNKDHSIIQIFSGRNANDIYHAIFKFEKKNNYHWFKEKTHIAYLGKELKKAELALTLGQTSYFQE